MTPRANPFSTAAAWLWSSPYLLLTLTMLFWAANFVVGRGVSGVVPPIALSFFRWLGAALLVAPLARGGLARDLPVLRHHWAIVLVLAAIGVAAFNTLVYSGLQTTTAINALLLQSSLPLLILACSFALFRDRIGALQWLGVAASLGGVAAIATQGNPADLLALTLHRGDALILLACVGYAFYSTLLRKRPPVAAMSFLFATFSCGAAILAPFFIWEMTTGAVTPLAPGALVAILYVIVFPGFLAYLFFNRGVELLGANRAGQFIHLMPMFGSLLAILFLGESFQLFHAIGIALIGAGIVLAGLSRRART